MIWNLKKIREDIDDCLAQIDAILAVAKDENRDLTKEEAAEVDALQGTDEKPGRLQELYAAEKRAARVEANREARVRTVGGHIIDQQMAGSIPGDSPKSIRVPATAKRHGKLKHFHGPDAEANAYLSGRFLMAAITKDQSHMSWLSDHGIKMEGRSDDNSKGGYLVPEVLENVLIDLKEEFGMFRRYAANWPMSSDVSLVPRRASGFQTYFVGQNEEITESGMTFDQVRLEAKKLAALTKFSSELNEDAIMSIADIYAREFAYALAVREDQCGFLGDGTSTFGGIVGLENALAAGSVSIASTITTAANLTLANFEAVVAGLPEFPGIQPTWYIHKALYHTTMGRLQVAAGGNTVSDVGSGPVMQFLGYPVRFIQTLPKAAATNVKIAYFGDLAMAATMGTRRGVTLAADSSKFFAEDALALRVTERFDINIHERGTTTTSGPIRALQMG
jgi:HK97 family phage major capsid protein